MNAGIIILAGGESARMGVPKQLLPYRGSTLLQSTIDTALALKVPVVVVLGAQAALIRPRLGATPVICVENPAWREGMGGTVRTGLEALCAAHPATDAALILLCDQPLVSAAVLTALLAEAERTGSPLVASEYSGTLGVPALFGREYFPELLALTGPTGARQVIQKHRDRAARIPFPEGSIDIDTPADYAELRKILA